jgi:hypothetical protein
MGTGSPNAARRTNIIITIVSIGSTTTTCNNDWSACTVYNKGTATATAIPTVT